MENDKLTKFYETVKSLNIAKGNERYSEDEQRQLEETQAKTLAYDEATLCTLMHSCLDLIPEINNVIISYVTMEDPQTMIVLRYFHDQKLIDGAIWYKQEQSSKCGYEEYATINDQPFVPARGYGMVQLLMHRRLSPNYPWVQDTVRA